MVGAKSSGTQFGDTTYTKIFVGGLPWETQRDTMKHYFQQFGEILEAVVITEKTTGRSKGYGFVTFKDPESAQRACQNPNPVIDGRTANCNLAVLGVQKDHPKFAGLMKRSRNIPTFPFLHTAAYFRQPNNNPQYAFPYSAYGYPSSFYPQDSFGMNYYNGYGGHGQGQGQHYHYPIGSSPSGPGGANYNYNYYYPFIPLYLYPEPQRGQSQSRSQSPPTTTSIPKVIIQHPYPYYPCIPLGPHHHPYRSDSVESLPLPTSVSKGPMAAAENNISV